MAATALTGNNLLSQARENIVVLLENQSNINDPTTTSAEYRKWIYSRDPDAKSLDFSSFPFIIVKPATLNFGEEQTGNRKIRSLTWGIEVEVVTSDRGNNNRNGKGQEDNDSISDSILSTLNNETNRRTLAHNGLSFIQPDVNSVVVEDFNDTLVFRRSFLIGAASKKLVF
jgi:hypothetical protein